MVDDNKTMIPSGKFRHALLILSADKQTYKVYGYLTSNKYADLLSKKQFKQFQNEQLGLPGSSSTKNQYILGLQNVEIVSIERVVILAKGEEYLESFVNKEVISTLKNKLDVKPSVEFYLEGYTKQDLIDIFLAFDNVMKTGEKHPKVEDSEVILKDKTKYD